jgi:hypothetical protein
MVAADLLESTNPLHKSFLHFCGENEPTKRKARAFLQKYPQYRGIKETDFPPTQKEG